MAIKTTTEATKPTKTVQKPTEIIKMDEIDLNTLKQLQQDTDKLIYNLGQLYVQKDKLSKTEESLKKAISNVDQREETLGKELSAKYGVGRVNIEDGTFTPAKS
jgi:uncharacterized protein HemY|tara:strand:+ start:592 stop:903 length:312 start_codon:yes stop_codon:yes gene_type:complete